MIRNGKYAQYKGHEYELNEDMEGQLVIITEDKKLEDDTFDKKYDSGIYSKIVNQSMLESVYKVTSYVLIIGEKLYVRKEKAEGYIVGTNDCEIAKEVGLNRDDKYGYEGWLSASGVEVVEEKEYI
ncbi:hypothetical protein [Anaerosporobacter sp.]